MLKFHPITAIMKMHANFQKIFLIRVFWFKYIFPIKYKIHILDLMLLPNKSAAGSIPCHGIFKCKENHFETRAITLYLSVEIHPSAIPRHCFSISTLIPSLKKIGKKMLKLESENKFLTSIKGYNSVPICQYLPICNPRTLLHNIDSHTKFDENQ